MKLNGSIVRRLVSTVVILCASALAAGAEADHGAIARAALTDYIRPAYSHLAKRSDALVETMGALCASPGPESLKDAKEAFADTVRAWGKVEILRFGPVAQDHRYERLFYWPDPKGLGLKQIRDALAKQGETLTLPDELATKSVALQGLPALEYLLYGDGAETLTKSDHVVDGQQSLPPVGGAGAFRCGFAQSIATNVDRIAKNLVEGWREGSASEKDFLSPGPDDPFYRAPKEVTLELLKAFSGGIETVRDQKLAKPLGVNAAGADPQLAPFLLSGLTLANIADNLDGLRELFTKGGFAALVHAESPGAEDSIVFDLEHAIDVLRNIDQPFADVVRDEETREQLDVLRVSLKSAEGTAVDMISRAAGLSFGSNAMDRD
jgi:predicted lipoprotein